MAEAAWKDSLEAFFAERADALRGRAPSLDELCWASGRDGRLWADPARHEALAGSVLALCRAGPTTRILEVGCGSGYIATAIAPRVAAYVGVDLAPEVTRLAKRLGLANARFQCADGASLPFEPATFDAAYCYDVFTNLPSFSDGMPLIRSMLRVVRPGGRVLVGSVPDRAQQARLEQAIPKVVAELDRQFGPSIEPDRPARPQMAASLRRWLKPARASAQIICFSFERQDFIAAAEELRASVELSPVHPENPYAEFRFNAVYEKRVC
jgi:ubiquinone/menaquinone biosynthesis C-methylase UbiE